MASLVRWSSGCLSRHGRARSFDCRRNNRRNRMPLSNSEAVPFGLLAMFAEDMYDAALGTLAPPVDLRIAAAGWKVVAYVTAQDVIIPPKESPDQKLHIDHGIQPLAANAGVRLDLLCDHHVICYCAMLDFQQTIAASLIARDAACRACVLGPASTMPDEAKALAVLINAFGMGSEKARILLKGMHRANTV